MSERLLRVLEHSHGHLGWLAALALAHPALLLRDRERRARLSASLATGVVTAAGAIGAYIYPDYRSQLKQQIFVHARSVGWNFERKEHLAIGAIVLAWAGLAAHLGAVRAADPAVKQPLARAAHLAFVAAFGLSVATALLGMLVATYKTF
jgi:hypothetical protein